MLRAGKISVSVLARLDNLEILGFAVGSFPVPHKGGLLTGNGSGSNTRLRWLIKGFSGEEHQFWGLVKSSGDALFVSAVSGIKMCGFGSLPLEPELQERGLCSQYQTQISAELLSSSPCTWPALKGE